MEYHFQYNKLLAPLKYDRWNNYEKYMTELTYNEGRFELFLPFFSSNNEELEDRALHGIGLKIKRKCKQIYFTFGLIFINTLFLIIS